MIANNEIEISVRKNAKKIIKWRELKDYKDRVKKFFKTLYNDIQNKLNQNV